MSLIYEEDEYEGLYSEYRHYPFFRDRAILLRDVLGPLRAKPLLVTGCGWGFLMKELEELGFENVWGMDASPYALSRAVEVLESDAQLILGDVLEGVPTGFRSVVSEDLLTCAEGPGEALEMARSMRSSTSTVVHLLTPGVQDHKRDPRVLWMTLESWRELVSPDTVLTT